jgi:MGT family glycosyltransferase
MSKILFLNQPTVGHLNTLLSIAIQMKDDGHDVCFLVPGFQGIRTNIQILDTGFAVPERIKRNGLICELMPPPLSVIWSAVGLPLKSGYAEIIHALNMFSEGIEHYTRHILKFIEIYRPDVLVTDFAFPATSLAADIAKVPYVVIYHSGLPFRGKGLPPFGSGLPIGSGESVAKEYVEKENRALNILDKRINRARQALGLSLAEPDILRRPYSPWLNLIASAECMEAPRENISQNTFFIGTCFGKRIEMAEFSFDFLRSDKFKIYVSLGTVFNKKPKVFLKIMRALDRPDYQVVVSAGGAYQTLQNSAIPSSATIFKSVPQVGLLPKIDLFISHGGNNSINEALSCGIPIIVMPIGGEQADNASRVVYLGVGKRVDITMFSEEQLRATVEEIRMNPTFQERVLTIMNGLQSTKGVVTASRCIDWVAQKRKPLYRKEGIPSTITPGHLEQLLGD